MSSAFNGSWKLKSIENWEAYLDALGLTEEHKRQAMKLLGNEKMYTQDISISENTITTKSTNPVGSKVTTAEFGKPFLDSQQGVGTFEILFTLDGDQIVTTRNGPYKSHHVSRVEGNELIVTFVANDVTSTWRYERTD